ncbi:tail fiber domain-containing protein [Ancylomarina sp. DW003]|nr:tail fiber domain-containing protein [Ancylomarina sp. DW003]MDE5424043.1 tail fiber domain-containing protein [Ancylomarina sp. DW003]
MGYTDIPVIPDGATPVDPRLIVSSKSDLTTLYNDSPFKAYPGMEVMLVDYNGKVKYRFIGDSYTDSIDLANWEKVDLDTAFTTEDGGKTKYPLFYEGDDTRDNSLVTHGQLRGDVKYDYTSYYDVKVEFDDPDFVVDGYNANKYLAAFYSNTGGKIYVHNLVTNKKYKYTKSLGSSDVRIAICNDSIMMCRYNASKYTDFPYITNGGATYGEYSVSSTVGYLRDLYSTNNGFYQLGVDGWMFVSEGRKISAAVSLKNETYDKYVSAGAYLMGINTIDRTYKLWRANVRTSGQVQLIRTSSLNSASLVANIDDFVIHGTEESFAMIWLRDTYKTDNKFYYLTFYNWRKDNSDVWVKSGSTNSYGYFAGFDTKPSYKVHYMTDSSIYLMDENTGWIWNTSITSPRFSNMSDITTAISHSGWDRTRNHYNVQMMRHRLHDSKFGFLNMEGGPTSTDFTGFKFPTNETVLGTRIIDSNEWDGGIEAIYGDDQVQLVRGKQGANLVLKLYRWNNTEEVIHSEVYNTDLKVMFPGYSTIVWYNSTGASYRDTSPNSSVTTISVANMVDLQFGGRGIEHAIAYKQGNSVYLSLDKGITFNCIYTSASTLYKFTLGEAGNMMFLRESSITAGKMTVEYYKPQTSALITKETMLSTEYGGGALDYSNSITFRPSFAQVSTFYTVIDAMGRLQVYYTHPNSVNIRGMNSVSNLNVIYRKGENFKVFNAGDMTALNRDDYGNSLTSTTLPSKFRTDITGFADGQFVIVNDNGFHTVRTIDEYGNDNGYLRKIVDVPVIKTTLTPRIDTDANTSYIIDNSGDIVLTYSGTTIGSTSYVRINTPRTITMNGTIISGTVNNNGINIIQTTCVNDLGDDTSYEHVIISPASGGSGGGAFDTIVPLASNSAQKTLRNTESDLSTDSIGIGHNALLNNDGYASIAFGERAGEGNKGFGGLFTGFYAGLNNTGCGVIGIGSEASAYGSGNASVAVGDGSGVCNTGTCVVSIGKRAGYHNTGNDSVFIGECAGADNICNRNTFLGSCAGKTFTNCGATAVGYCAANGGGGQLSVALGICAGLGNTCSRNIMVGANSGIGQTGYGSIMIGYYAGNCATNSTHTVNIGEKAGCSSTSSSSAVNIGTNAGAFAKNSSGAVNIGSGAGCCAGCAHVGVNIGQSAGKDSTGTRGSVNIGWEAGCSSGESGGYATVFIGQKAGCCSVSNGTIAIGSNAGVLSECGSHVIIGGGAGQKMRGGYGNIALGSASGTYLQGCYNFGAGGNTLNKAIGSNNFVGGFCAGHYLEADNVIAIGDHAGRKATSNGSILFNSTSRVANKVILPKPGVAGAGLSFTVGDHGLLAGTSSAKVIGAGFGLINSQNVTVTVVDDNTFTIAENLTTTGEAGDVKLQIGTPLSNVAIINPKAYETIDDVNIPVPTASNQMHYGNKEMSKHIFYGDVECTGEFVGAGGGSTPSLQDVTDAGNSTTNNIVTTGTATASNFILSSDERLKTFKNEPIVDVSSIDIRKFSYNDDETNRDRYGVSAQELQKVAPEMVYEDDEGMLSVGYTDFLLARIAKLEKLVYKLMEDK